MAHSGRGLQLLTHPELWCAGQIRDRLRHCDEVLLPLVSSEVTEFASREVRGFWLAHDAARLHDEREQSAGSSSK